MNLAWACTTSVTGDSVRLRAMIAWRGEPLWYEADDEGEPEAERATLDSLVEAAVRRGNGGGLGDARGAARAWVEVSRTAPELVVGDERIALPEDGRVLVVLVDRVDFVRGPPEVTVLAMPAPDCAVVPRKKVVRALGVWRKAMEAHEPIAFHLRGHP